MTKYYITAVGTGIGKTILTTSLCYQLQEAGKKVAGIKPVISGYDYEDTDNDVSLLLQSTQTAPSHKNADKISFYRFKEPTAPHIAAKNEGKIINYKELLSFCVQKIQNHQDYLLIEGAGGVSVPLTDNKTTLDLLQDLMLPAILVTGTYLGSLSHTLTAVDALNAREINIKCIVVSESQDGVYTTEETANIINKHTNTPVHTLPWIESQEKKWQNAPDLLHILSENNDDKKRYG